MRKSRSKLRKVVPLILSLAAGSAAVANAQSNPNDPIFNTPTGDFIFVTDYMHNTNRNESTNIDSLVKGGNVTRIYALSPEAAIQSRIKFLDSARAKDFYSQEERLDLIGRYKNFLSELSKQKIAPSAKSLEGLSNAVRDGTINPVELKDVEDSIYAIVKEGVDKTTGPYSVFYLTRLTSETTPVQYQEKIKKLENDYNDLVKKMSELEKKASKEAPEPSLQLPTPERGKLPLPQVPAIPKKAEEENYVPISLVTELNSNFVFNTFGGAVGVRLAPFKDKKLGLAGLLDLNFSLDKPIDSYSDSLSAGRSAYGTINETGASSIGLLAELQYGPLFIGGGANLQSWTANVLEQILDSSGSVIKSNANSTPNRQVFGKIYGGAEFPIGDIYKLGATIGYDGKNGAYFGLRNTFRLNSKKK